MATKYWVGGTGTWDGFTATNWSDTSGGPGGAIAPCALDDVVFNSASNALAYTVTINTGAVCRDLTIDGPAAGNVTVAGSGDLGVFGSLTLPATGITRTYTGAITFRATTTGKTITTNGVTLANNITFNGVGGAWALGSAFQSTGGSTVATFTNGTFDTANYALTLVSIASGSSGVSTLNLGSSTVTLSGNSTMGAFNSNVTTLNAGTSTITTNGSGFTVGSSSTSGSTFYNLTITAGATIGLVTINGANTFNNLTLPTLANSLATLVTINDNQTVTGTLTLSGAGAISRYLLQSNIIGTARTLTVGTVSSLTDVDFRDIIVAGTSAPWSGTRLGNAGGNTNITFGAGVNKYWNLPIGGAWISAAWATSSGGTADVLNFPLAQDTVIIENTGLNTSASITGVTSYHIKTLDCSTRSNAATLSGSSLRINDDLTLSTAMTVTGLSVLFEGRTTQTITSAGRTLGAITVNNSGSTATLADAYNGSTITLTSGTFDTNNQNVTLSSSLSVTANALNKTWTFGSSTISCNAFSGSAGISNLTINAGTSSITLSSGLALSGGTYTFYNVTSSNAASTNIGWDGIFIFNNLTFTAPTTVGNSTVTFGGNQTVNGTLALGGGTSVTQRRGFISSVIGTAITITAATVTGMTDVDFQDITGAGAASWTGTRIGDRKGNSGITFTAGATKYWNLAGAQDWSSTGWALGSGGTPAVNNFPLAQDTVIFDNTGAAGTVTIQSGTNWHVGTVDLSARTSAMTLAGSTLQCHGDFVNGSGLTVTGLALNFVGRTTQTVTPAGKTFADWALTSPGGTLSQAAAWTSNSTVNFNAGTFNTQNYNLTVNLLNVNPAAAYRSSTSRVINLGSSTITISGTSPVNIASAVNLTFNAGTSTINMSSGSAKTFAGGGQTFSTVTSTGGTTAALTITGSNTFTTLSNTAYTYLILTSGTTQTFTNFNYTGASGSVVRISTTTPGLTATVQKPSAWYAGANSTDGGNNTGWTFTAGGSTDYVYLKDIIATVVGGAGGKFFYLF